MFCAPLRFAVVSLRQRRRIGHLCHSLEQAINR